ncbi:MAG: DNRLRE domain-containing protein, partial [Bacteroidota bacterium]
MKQVKGLLHIVMMCGIVAGVHAQSTTTTLEFQDGMDGYAGTRDTKLLSDSPTTAWGTTINHAVDGDPDKSALVLWDLSAIPAGAVALSAEVQLFVNNETADTYYVHQMTAPWDEAAATWENASSGTAWSAPGAAADHAPDTLAMVGPAVFGYVTFEVPAAVVQAWLDNPESNQGLIFKNYDSATDGMEFDSRENANRGHRPKLTLTYEGDPPPPPVDGASGAQRFRLAWRDDPATTMVVGWDQARGDGAMLCYDTVDHGSELQGAGCSPYALSHGVDVVHDYKGMNNSFARLTGLQPNTVYYFVVRDNLGTSERYSFRTSPATPDVPFTFIAGGDSRTNILDPVPIDQENRAARRRANEMVAKLAPLFVAFNGDMTMKSSAEQWQDWMDDWQLTVRDSDNRLVPIIPGVGDHERFHERLTWLEGADLDRLFDVANPDGFYHYTFGGNLLSHYSLNIKLSPDDEFFGTEVAWNAQTEWLRGELEADAATWKVVQYQDPMRPVVNSKEDRQDS